MYSTAVFPNLNCTPAPLFDEQNLTGRHQQKCHQKMTSPQLTHKENDLSFMNRTSK